MGLFIDFSALIAGDEEQLYRNLSNPEDWPLDPDVGPVARASALSRLRLTPLTLDELRVRRYEMAEELRADRRARAESHRQIAHDLKHWATVDADEGRIGRLLSAAE